FLNFHVERLQKGLQLLHFDEVTKFDVFFLRSKAEELIRKNNMIGHSVRVRLILFRDGGGLYTPETNKPAYILQVDRLPVSVRDKKLGLIVDVYTEYKKPYSELSQLK